LSGWYTRVTPKSMSSFRKNSRAKKQPVSIDGILTGNRPLGIRTNRAYKPSSKGLALDNFSTHDGFRAGVPALSKVSAGPQPLDAATLDEPIVLDDIDKPKTGKRRRPPGSHRSRRRRLLKRTLFLFAAFILVAGGYFGYRLYHTQKQFLAGGGHAPAVCNGDVPVDLLKKEGDSRVNTLLLGIGSEGLLTDTIMIASLDPINDRLDLLSIPRDLWVKFPSNGYERINAAYEFGEQVSKNKENDIQRKRDGVKLADQTIESILNIPIHYNVLVDFNAFKVLVDTLGGVTVNVPEQLYDPTIAWENGYNPIIARKGIQTMDGKKALLYAKSRQTSSDFERAERQRLLFVAIKDKGLSVGTYSNPLKVLQLLDGLGENVYTDFDTGSIKCLYKQISEVPSASITSLDLVTPPHDLLASGAVPGKSTLAPKAGLFTYDAIQNYVHSALRDGFLARENATVAVYNGTNTASLATKKSDELRSYGYLVTKVTDAPAKDYQKTVLVDLTGGVKKYTRHYLEQRFGATALTSLPDNRIEANGIDFAIILGADVR